MIIEVIFEMAKMLIMTVLGILPNIPDVPQAIDDGVDTVLYSGTRVFQYTAQILGYEFTAIVAGCLLVMLFFNQVYHLTMWIIRKLPIGAH